MGLGFSEVSDKGANFVTYESIESSDELRSLPSVPLWMRKVSPKFFFFSTVLRLDVYRMIREFEPIRMREKHATGKSHDVGKNRWKMRRRVEVKRRWTWMRKKLNSSTLRSIDETLESLSIHSFLMIFLFKCFLCNLAYWMAACAARGVCLSCVFDFDAKEEKYSCEGHSKQQQRARTLTGWGMFLFPPAAHTPPDSKWISAWSFLSLQCLRRHETFDVSLKKISCMTEQSWQHCAGPRKSYDLARLKYRTMFSFFFFGHGISRYNEFSHKKRRFLGQQRETYCRLSLFPPA